MVDYIRLANRTQKLLSKYGFTVTIERTVEGEAPDPDTPWRKGEPGTLTVTTRGVKEDYPVDKLQSDAFQPGDIKLYIPAKGMTFDPARGDFAVFDGDTWGVENAVPVKPADIAILWELQVRLWPRRAASQ